MPSVSAQSGIVSWGTLSGLPWRFPCCPQKVNKDGCPNHPTAALLAWSGPRRGGPSCEEALSSSHSHVALSCPPHLLCGPKVAGVSQPLTHRSQALHTRRPLSNQGPRALAVPPNGLRGCLTPALPPATHGVSGAMGTSGRHRCAGSTSPRQVLLAIPRCPEMTPTPHPHPPALLEVVPQHPLLSQWASVSCELHFISQLGKDLRMVCDGVFHWCLAVLWTNKNKMLLVLTSNSIQNTI